MKNEPNFHLKKSYLLQHFEIAEQPQTKEMGITLKVLNSFFSDQELYDFRLVPIIISRKIARNKADLARPHLDPEYFCYVTSCLATDLFQLLF